MKKTIALISLLVLMLWLVGCNKKTVNISTFHLRLEMLKPLNCTAMRERPFQQKRKLLMQKKL